MAQGRPAVCMALDPVADALESGRMVNRHCGLPAGHHGFHRSRNTRGEVVHEWLWTGENEQPTLYPQGRLF